MNATPSAKRHVHVSLGWLCIRGHRERLTRPPRLVLPSAKDKRAALEVWARGREDDDKDGESAREGPNERRRVDERETSRQENVDRDGDELRWRAARLVVVGGEVAQGERITHDEPDEDDDGLVRLGVVLRMRQRVSSEQQASRKRTSRRRQGDPPRAAEPAGDPRNSVCVLGRREDGRKVVWSTRGREDVNDLAADSQYLLHGAAPERGDAGRANARSPHSPRPGTLR